MIGLAIVVAWLLALSFTEYWFGCWGIARTCVNPYSVLVTAIGIAALLIVTRWAES